MKGIRNLFSSRLQFATFFLIALLVFATGCAKKEIDEIKIGAIFPLTGDAALYGENIKYGIDLAVEEINENGGIKGHNIKVIYEDSQALPAEGVSAFNKLTEIHSVSAVLAGAVSSVTLAIAPLAEKKKVVVLSPLSSAPSITDAGDFIFRTVPSDLYGGKVAANFTVRYQGAERLAILFVNNDFGRGLMDVFKEEVESLGGKVVASEAYEQGNTDFRTQLIKIKDTKPSAIFLVGYSESAQVLIQAKELGIRIPFLGTGLLEDPKIIEVAKEAAEAVFFTQLQYDPNLPDSTIKTFVIDFKQKYGSEPSIIAAYAYDAMKVLAFAMTRSDFSPVSIKEQLYNVSAFNGVTGNITFDHNGDVIQDMGIKQIKGGRFVWFEKTIEIK